MLKRILFLTSVLVASQTCQASIAWASSTTGGFLVRDTDPGSTPLLAGTTSTVGYFAMLIRDVGNDGADPVNNLTAGNVGVTDDDVVVDVAFFGSARGLNPLTNGRLHQQDGSEPHVQGANYYVRVWNAPARATFVLTHTQNEGTLIPNFDSLTGLNSTTGNTLRYGDSAVFNAAASDTTAIVFNFEAATNTAYVIVPEPTTAALLGLGASGIMMALKRRRQGS